MLSQAQAGSMANRRNGYYKQKNGSFEKQSSVITYFML